MGPLETLENAIYDEHPCEDENGCDIAQAMKRGLTLWAAHILTGATECPQTEAAYSAVQAELGETEFAARLEREREQLCRVDHMKCPRCNAVVYEPDDCDECPNCAKPLESHYVIRFTVTDESDYGHVHHAIVAARSLDAARERWDSHVCDVTGDVWGSFVTEHYTESAEHSDPGFVYVMRSCDCGDDDCETANHGNGHESLTTAVGWDVDGFVCFSTLEDAKAYVERETNSHSAVIVAA